MRNVSSLTARFSWKFRSKPPNYAKTFRPCLHSNKAFGRKLRREPRPPLRPVENFPAYTPGRPWTSDISQAIKQILRTLRAKMPSTSKKRKMDDDAPKFYAVRSGYAPGIYLTWPECLAQISGFKGAQFKKFDNQQDASDFVAGRTPRNTVPDPKKPIKFYAVARGRVPGIYTDWTEAQAAFDGWKEGIKQQSFKTRAEAVEFIRVHGNAPAQKAIANEAVEPPAKKSRTSKSSRRSGLLQIYTDGSSRGNGKAGARAGVGVFFGVDDPRNISERLEGEPQTNQRAELTAILRALQGVSVDQDIEIVTDSQYSIDCVKTWYINWAKKDWMTSTNNPVKNKDLIQAIRAKIEGREASGTKTLFQWVKGHNATAGNVEADKLATSGALLSLFED